MLEEVSDDGEDIFENVFDVADDKLEKVNNDRATFGLLLVCF